MGSEEEKLNICNDFRDNAIHSLGCTYISEMKTCTSRTCDNNSTAKSLMIVKFGSQLVNGMVQPMWKIRMPVNGCYCSE